MPCIYFKAKWPALQAGPQQTLRPSTDISDKTDGERMAVVEDHPRRRSTAHSGPEDDWAGPRARAPCGGISFVVASWCCQRKSASESTTRIWTADVQRESKISPQRFSGIFTNRLGIFSQNFTCLLYILIYTRLPIFIQLTATLTDLCHIKRDHHHTLKMSTIGRNAG